jgi:hypothetical protein
LIGKILRKTDIGNLGKSTAMGVKLKHVNGGGESVDQYKCVWFDAGESCKYSLYAMKMLNRFD